MSFSFRSSGVIVDVDVEVDGIGAGGAIVVEKMAME